MLLPPRPCFRQSWQIILQSEDLSAPGVPWRTTNLVPAVLQRLKCQQPVLTHSHVPCARWRTSLRVSGLKTGRSIPAILATAVQRALVSPRPHRTPDHRPRLGPASRAVARTTQLFADQPPCDRGRRPRRTSLPHCSPRSARTPRRLPGLPLSTPWRCAPWTIDLLQGAPVPPPVRER